MKEIDTQATQSAISMETLMKRFSQPEIYRRLQSELGSPWLREHVLFADRKMVVFNKPPNLICQLDSSVKPHENSYALNPVFDDVKRWIPSADPCTIHRLDKATTGCLVVALSPSVAKTISKQTEQRTFSKTYLALVRGGKKAFDVRSGRIEQRLAYNNGRGFIDDAGKEAITDWELLGCSDKAAVSLLKFNLITGNKHQLRLHSAKILGAPILGDDLHSLSDTSQSILRAARVPEDRLFLHAYEASLFRYHERGKRYRLGFRAPVPIDFQRICRDLGISLPPSFVEPQLLIDGAVVDEDSELKLWSQVK